MKKILIIGAGFLQSFVIQKAKELGYYTFAIDKNPNSIGFKYADEHQVIDIVNQEACLKYAYSKKIDGVMTAATDYGVLSAAYIAEKMNLPGLHYEVAKMIKNKYKVRKKLIENHVDDMVQHYEISNMDSLNAISGQIQFPVIVKPCDGSGSKAVKKVDCFQELKNAIKDAMNTSLIEKVLIEDFIEGKEYGVESIVVNNEIQVLGVMEKWMTSPPDYAELGHCLGSHLEIEEKIVKVVKESIGALGINFGAVNMDLLVTKERDICIVDVGARMGGNLIGSHIIPVGTGIDYMKSLIKMSVGDSVELTSQKERLHIATRILALKEGEIVKLPDFTEIEKRYQVKIYHYLKAGDVIKEYHNNLDGCGYVISIDKDVKIAEMRAEKAKHIIDTSIIRKSFKDPLEGEKDVQILRKTHY